MLTTGFRAATTAPPMCCGKALGDEYATVIEDKQYRKYKERMERAVEKSQMAYQPGLDDAFKKLVKMKGWERCSCGCTVERISGCYTVQCLCGRYLEVYYPSEE